LELSVDYRVKMTLPPGPRQCLPKFQEKGAGVLREQAKAVGV